MTRRLETLEGRIRQRQPESQRSSDARQHMKSHLDRLAAWRRGELAPEEVADLAAETAEVERQFAALAKLRGEGVR